METIAALQPVACDASHEVATPANTSTPLTLQMTEMNASKKPWTLTLHPQHLALADAASAQPYIILREQVLKTAFLAEATSGFVLRTPFKLTCKLTREDTRALADWIGKLALARYYVKRRYSWMLPVAILWMLSSVPIPADPVAGVAAEPFSAFRFGLGAVLGVAWFCSKRFPHPLLFLIDSIWFIAAGSNIVSDVMKGATDKGWLLMLLFVAGMVYTGFKHFARFRNVKVT